MKTSSLLLVSLLMTTSAAFAQAAPAPGAMPPGPPPGGAPQGPPGGFPNMPTMGGTSYQAAVTVKDGALQTPKVKSVSAQLADGLTLTSAQPAFNGIIVSGGKSAFTLRNSQIKLSGPGTNDFLGVGAGALVRDKATLILDGATIETNARISSAVVAAEEATLRIYNSHLVAKGGALPLDYKPVIGPGMMEPPAPLELSGTARTLLAMSNSHTYVYNSIIEADGWGALSTDATGGQLYLEANDCIVKVRKAGYGTYADFGAHVVLNRTRVESGANLGIIAGKARIDLNAVSGRAGTSAVMIHSVMAFNVDETAELNVTDSLFSSAGPVFLVKSANADISVKGGALTSDTGILLEVRKNSDPNATQTRGARVPGVHLKIAQAQLAGDVIDSDPDREAFLVLDHAKLTGALRNVTLEGDAKSHWTARANSSVTLAPGTAPDIIDAPSGVLVTARIADPAVSAGERALPSGGRLAIIR